MAVREFNGTSDELVTATGGASAATFGTFAVLLKLSSVADFQSWCAPHDSGGTFLADPIALTNFTSITMYSGADSLGSAVSTGIWYLIVDRKVTGTAAARFSVYNYNTTSWTHTAGTGTIGNWTAPGASGTFRFTFQGTSNWTAGRIAARAVWANTLPWTADASGDTALQSAGLHTAAASWLSNSPSAFWLFNQASTATAVPDSSTTGTATQTSLTGTTVINGDDPPGFDFALAAAPPPPTTVQAAGPWPCF